MKLSPLSLYIYKTFFLKLKKIYFILVIKNCLFLSLKSKGIVMTMEKKSAKKIEKLLKLIEKLKTENEQLKNVINEKNLIIENLQKSNKT